ncbi:uncharacterized protein LOC142981073 [Anticarsia gemmatalis]|uniref:uncharacterized protein LOC142981073 n=1 Tax=Anticarsia gemmatalis TaxID=129554 RepID=UPI003F7715B1
MTRVKYVLLCFLMFKYTRHVYGNDGSATDVTPTTDVPLSSQSISSKDHYEFQYHKAGSRAVFSCHFSMRDFGAYIRRWYIPKYNDLPFPYTLLTTAKTTILTLNSLEDFDDGTILNCDDKTGLKHYHVNVTAAIPFYYSDNITEVYYYGDETVPFDCSAYSNNDTQNNYTHAMIKSRDKIKVLPTIKGHVNITTNHNRTMIFCIHYSVSFDEIKDVDYYTRYVSGKTKLIYMGDVKPITQLPGKYDGGAWYIYTAAVLVGAALVVFTIFHYRRRKANQLQNKRVEDTEIELDRPLPDLPMPHEYAYAEGGQSHSPEYCEIPDVPQRKISDVQNTMYYWVD